MIAYKQGYRYLGITDTDLQDVFMGARWVAEISAMGDFCPYLVGEQFMVTMTETAYSCLTQYRPMLGKPDTFGATLGSYLECCHVVVIIEEFFNMRERLTKPGHPDHDLTTGEFPTAFAAIDTLVDFTRRFDQVQFTALMDVIMRYCMNGKPMTAQKRNRSGWLVFLQQQRDFIIAFMRIFRDKILATAT